MPCWTVVRGVTWTTLPADPVRVTAWTRPSSMAIRRQVSAGASFGDADEQQGEPAEQDVGADAWFEAVEDGPQLEGGLQVAEPRSASSRFL